MTDEDQKALNDAVKSLECAGFAMKAANAIGTPIERAIESLPESVRALIQEATKRTLDACLRIALSSLSNENWSGSYDVLHKATCNVSGALGGFFGIYALPLELPVSTTIMLRSIADIARSEGEHFDDIDAKLACISVLAMGARSPKDDNADIGYFAVRATLAKALPNVADRAVPPALARFMAVIAERFGITVSEKAVAELIPVVGAVGGGAINLVFINHFQDIAHGHFTVRRLERQYGENVVRQAYERQRSVLTS
jgi:EcsC family protein